MKIVIFSKQLLAAGMVAAGLLASQATLAAVWTNVGPASSIDIGNITISYTPTPATSVMYYDGNLTPQNPSAIQGDVETAFGLAANSLTYASQCDTPTGGCTNATATEPSTNTFKFTSTNHYDYLAIHFGGAELVFHWDSPLAANTVFMLTYSKDSGKPTFGGLSTYRAYLGPQNVVPIPAAAWLFGSALAGLVGFGWKRKVSITDGLVV